MLKQIQNFVLDLIFPPFCLVCGKYGVWLCKNCSEQARFPKTQACMVCEKPSLNGLTHPICANRNCVDGILSSGEFSQLQPIIHSFKYNLISDLAADLSAINLRFLKNGRYENFFADFCLVPVPLHSRRLAFRGFNQSELLAKAISEQFKIPIKVEILQRVKNTDAQTTLNQEHRKENIKDAFVCPAPTEAKNKKILLIDDIATTGATLN
ncbi:MAG: double zinc ribbon domain-containing protein, partial [Patescibacteria group bacterium]